MCQQHSPLEARPQEGTICPVEKGLLQSQLSCQEERHALILLSYSTGSPLSPAALAEGSVLCQAVG